MKAWQMVAVAGVLTLSAAGLLAVLGSPFAHQTGLPILRASLTVHDDMPKMQGPVLAPPSRPPASELPAVPDVFCVTARDPNTEALGAWYGDQAPNVTFVPNTHGRRFRNAQDCVRRGLAGANIMFIGDSLVRYQYLSFVYFLRHGVYPDVDILHTTKSFSYGGSDSGWDDWDAYLVYTNEVLGANECCQCQRREGAIAVENRFYHDPEFQFNVTFIALVTGATGSDSMMGWSPTCTRPVGGHMPAINVTWPEGAQPGVHKSKSVQDMVDHINRIMGSRGVDFMTFTTGWWKQFQWEFASNNPERYKPAVAALESVMAPGKLPHWVTHAGAQFKGMSHSQRLPQSGAMMESSEIELVEYVVDRGWPIIPRRNIVQDLKDQLIAARGGHPMDPGLVYTDFHVHLGAYVNAALNDHLLDYMLPEPLPDCRQCGPADE